MASLTTNALCIPTMAGAMPRRSLIVASVTAKSPEHQESAAKGDGSYSGGRRRAMILLAGATAITASAAIGQSARADGGWEEIKNVSDPYVEEIGNWAVMKHNELTGEKLQFSEVVKGWKQVVAGTNYMLDLKTKGSSRTYSAMVFDPLPNTAKERQLNFFRGLLA
uniref:Psei8 n=1 Tax=Arundo donax TaxID=35708 RepID=A0A0A8XUI8_ARUDO